MRGQTGDVLRQLAVQERGRIVAACTNDAPMAEGHHAGQSRGGNHAAIIIPTGFVLLGAGYCRE